MAGPITDPEGEFLANLPLIIRLARGAARARRFPPANTEDFVSHVQERFIENDYARLRKFRGEGTLPGFLAVTITKLSFDYADHLWTKWRPPIAVRRLGTLAVLLYQLLTRDRLQLEAAYETLWTNHGCTATRAELDALVGQFPPSATGRIIVTDDTLKTLPSPDRPPDDAAARQEALALVARANAVLQLARAALSPQDRLILALHFRDGMKVSDVARQLGLPQQPLYDRIKAALARLRRALEAEGLTAELLIPLLADWDVDPGWN